VLVAGLVALVLAGCAAPADDDGELVPGGRLPAAPATSASATRVVVDTDLGADDLAALALLLRHPGVDVEAVTVAATGLVGCAAGVDLVSDLLAALEEPAVPVACGRPHPGPGGRSFPAAWRYAAAAGAGLPRDPGPALPRDPRPAAELIGDLAGAAPGLAVVALGPLTNLADLATADPGAYAALDRVQVMAGVVDGPGQDGVGEWNVAADPAAARTVLAVAGPSVTVVPADAVPDGTPDGLAAPVLGAVAAAAQLPAWWDLATSAALVTPDAATVQRGTFELDGAEPGRLRRAGAGPVTLVRQLDGEQLEAAYAAAFLGG
jgi:hypothetical protein